MKFPCLLCQSPPQESSGGRNRYCEKHKRMSWMRRNSRGRGKAVPRFSELEALWPQDMICTVCRCKMVISANRARHVISIQHDASGAVRLICKGCNAKHGALPGDLFYQLTAETRYCQCCTKILPLSEFNIRRSTGDGYRHYCRSCTSIKNKRTHAARKAREAASL